MATALGVTSIVFGLALQDPLGSVFTGIMLLFERPFSVGDWLQVGEYEGKVIDMNWRAVRLLTIEHDLIVVPHQMLGKEIIRNSTEPDHLYYGNVKVGFSYENPPNTVKQVLVSTALSIRGILPEPEPICLVISYDDTVITYQVRFFVKKFEDIELMQDKLMTRIWYSARRKDLSLYHYNYESSREDVASNIENPAIKMSQGFSSIPAFVSVTREPHSLEQLTKGTTLQHFGKGETALAQGNRVFCLYIIISGHAIMTVLNDAGKELEVSELSKGEFFGEMALFSREPTPVSVTAIEDMEVMVIDSDTVNAMIERQPILSREIAQVIEMRRHAINIAQRTGTLAKALKSSNS